MSVPVSVSVRGGEKRKEIDINGQREREREREREERERESTESRVLIIHSDMRRHQATSQKRPYAAGQVNLQDFSFSCLAIDEFVKDGDGFRSCCFAGDDRRMRSMHVLIRPDSRLISRESQQNCKICGRRHLLRKLIVYGRSSCVHSCTSPLGTPCIIMDEAETRSWLEVHRSFTFTRLSSWDQRQQETQTNSHDCHSFVAPDEKIRRQPCTSSIASSSSNVAVKV